MSKKCFVLDTNVLLSDPNAIFNFSDNDLIIPSIVIEELDNAKVKFDEVGRNARIVSNYLDGFREQGSLVYGVQSGKSLLKIVSISPDMKQSMPVEYSNMSIPDNVILATALEQQNKNPNRETILVTKDTNLRIKSDIVGVQSENYQAERVTENLDEFYKGYKVIDSDSILIDKIYTERTIQISDEFINEHYLFPNEFLILKEPNNPSKSALVRYVADGKMLREVTQFKDVFGIKPRNVEQQFALDLLFDDNIKLITLVGTAGSGKTLLSIAAGISQVIEQNKFEKLVITKPVSPVGKEIGYLPGPQPLDVKILTPSGWTQMGNLKVGDFVSARDGKPTKVLGIFPKGEKQVYKITTTDGVSTEACEDHLWLTKTYNPKNKTWEESVKSTKDIKNSLVRNDGVLNHHLPINEPIEFNIKNELPLTPYTLGALLGDGSIGDKITLCGVDQEVFDRVGKEISHLDCEMKHNPKYLGRNISMSGGKSPSGKRVKITNLLTNKSETYSRVGVAAKHLQLIPCTISKRARNNSIIGGFKFEYLDKQSKWGNPVKEILDNLGLLHKNYHEKFIPNDYKYSSINDRLALIQGLMDTDGTIKTNGEASYCTSSKELALDFIEVVKSLGGQANLRARKQRKSYILNGQEIKANSVGYEFNIRLPNGMNPFHISRKANRVKTTYKQTTSRIKSIEPVGVKPVQCILIDNPEHLYITDNFIVTHNTKQEKMEPWIAPIKDNLNYLCGNRAPKAKPTRGKIKEEAPPVKTWNYSDRWFEEGLIEVEAITYMRGRSIPNAIIIIDETQNISKHELKTIITRAGENTKIILTGDIDQIDNSHVDAYTNGLTYAVEKFKNFSIAGHVFMAKGERSQLATLAAQIL